MERAVVGRMPLWTDENQSVETAMMRDTEREGAEYRRAGGHQGRRAGGADPKGLKNNQDFKGQEGRRV